MSPILPQKDATGVCPAVAGQGRTMAIGDATATLQRDDPQRISIFRGAQSTRREIQK